VGSPVCSIANVLSAGERGAMGEEPKSTLRLSLRAAACTLAGDARDPAADARVRSAVDAQLRRAGVAAQDADDLRTEVALALLCAPAAELPLPLELVCARAAAIARHKAIDHGRRRARAPLALGDALPEPPDAGARPGSLADGLDEVAATAHRRRVRADLVLALDGLEPAQRAAIRAHADGGAARAAGLPRSTYYRVLAHAQARLRSDLRGRLAGLGALGGVVQRAREVFQHVEAVHGAAAAATAAVAVSAAVVLSLHDEGAHRLPPPVAAVALGGRVAAAPLAVARAAPVLRAVRQRTIAPAPAPAPAPVATHAAAVAAAPPPSSCTYDPSSYEC
jgi:DNA-directed RNA polymerase specialized sigma24 family protein